MAYDSNTLHTMKEHDPDDRIIYVRSLSQIFASGMRLGYLVSPTRLIESFAGVKRIADTQLRDCPSASLTITCETDSGASTLPA